VEDKLIELFIRALPLLMQGLAITLFLGVVSFMLGSVIGFLLTVARLFGGPILHAVAVAYISLIRGTPILVQILIVYFGLPQIGIQLDAIPSAVLALSLHAAAYLAEDFRAGFLAVQKGQWEAGYTLGMSFTQALRRVILPQALRIITPPVGSRFITLMKDTSLASVVTVVELTRVAESVGSATFRYMEMFIIVALIYWVVNTLLSLGQAGLERRLAKAY
jgi:cystine transport system permease protein